MEEKASLTSVNLEVTESDLKDGAFEFERFWLRPQSRAGKIVPLRLRINKRFGGWKLKDELVSALGLTIGDCINTEVSVLFGGNLIDETDETDLFADGSAADWLLDVVTKAEGPIGCIVDCYALLSYCQAPVGGAGKVVNKVSLILKNGIRFVRVDTDYRLTDHHLSSSFFERLLSSDNSSLG